MTEGITMAVHEVGRRDGEFDVFLIPTIAPCVGVAARAEG